jgi:NADH oxidase (H2O2-forming)
MSVKRMKIVIIGGSTSGTICAWKLRKLNKEHEIIIIEESSNLQYSPCAMPYVIAGKTTREKIVLLSKKDYADNNISILNNTFVKNFLPNQKKVIIESGNGEKEMNYDVLVLAMGSVPFNPGINIRTNNYSYFKTLEDMDDIIKNTKNKDVITIIGAGFIGVETAHALKSTGKKVTLIEVKDQVLQAMLDPDMALIVEEYLKNEGIEILKEEFVKEIFDDKIITNKQELKSDYTILSVGVLPKIDIARNAGIDINIGILTNEFQQTNISNIYACGDCSEIKCSINNKSIITGLANTASMQADIVAKNILGLNEKIEPAIISSISKIGELYVGSSGLNLIQTKDMSEKVVFAKHSSYTTSDYYSTKNEIFIKLLSNMSEEIIGAQVISKENISGYLNLINLAIKNKITLSELSKLETPYNPASNPLHDPMISAVNILLKKIRFLNKR